MKAAIAMVLLAGCSYLADDPPDRSCSTDIECFRAQGEVCDRTRSTCVIPPDAGPRSDAGEVDAGLDAGELDAGFDAGEPDAGEPDATMFGPEKRP